MSLDNFLKLLYRSVVPKPEPKPEIVVKEEHALPLPVRSSVGKYMTSAFNAICTQSEVQCTVTMDPTDFQQIYIFKNLGTRLAKVEWSKEIRFIEPGESAVIKARHFLDIHGFGNYEIPRITSLNNGVS